MVLLILQGILKNQNLRIKILSHVANSKFVQTVSRGWHDCVTDGQQFEERVNLFLVRLDISKQRPVIEAELRFVILVEREIHSLWQLINI